MAKKEESPEELRLVKNADRLVNLMQQMQSEFTELCQLKRDMAAKCTALDKLLPDLEGMQEHVATLRTHVETLMKEREEQNAALLLTLPTGLRPSVDSKPSPDKVDAVWEQGSKPQTVGMETDPRDRRPDPRPA